MQKRFPGLIIKEQAVHTFTIKQCPSKHAGLGRVLINYSRRDNSRRFQIVRLLTPKGKTAHAAVIGHYGPSDHIKMDYDLRKALQLNVDEVTQIEVRRCRFPGTLYWYLSVPDPLVRIPALLAVLSVALGVLSIVIAFFA